jgi:hypothetical protein
MLRKLEWKILFFVSQENYVNYRTLCKDAVFVG